MNERHEGTKKLNFPGGPGGPVRRRPTVFLVACACVLLLAPGFHHRASAQVEVPSQRDTVEMGKLMLTGYPYLFYSPETQFALGGALIFTRRLSSDPGVKPSNAIISGYYSASHSYDIFFNPEFFLDKDKYYIGVSVDFYRFVDKFWGIGNNTPDIDDAGYIRKIFWVNTEFDISVLGPLKVGLNYDLNYTRIEDKQLNPFLLAGSVTGSDGGVSSGVGLVLFADTRDGAFSPTAGGYYKLSLLNTFTWLGSQFTFARFILDLRQYVRIVPRLVLAAQFYASRVTGDPPFYLYPALGGDNAMRGYYEGRYRDKLYMALQGELRFQVARRWGLVGWVGIGDVAAATNSMKLTQFKPTFGLGIRFALDPVEALNIRADFAHGKDSQGMYFNAKEAF